MKLPKTLPAPELPANLSTDAKWLAGEGAGSWFIIEQINQNDRYCVCRYSPKGTLECGGVFEADDTLDLELEYSLGYPAHCLKVTVMQQGRRIILTSEDG